MSNARTAARPKPPSLELQIDAQVDELDRLRAAVASGIRSQSHYDELEERADAIATGIRDAFRRSRR